MKTTLSKFRITSFAIIAFGCFQVTAQDTVRVLSSKSVESGGRTITFQRIEPPPQVEMIAPPLATAVNPAQQTALNQPKVWRAKKYKMLALSCTVREPGVTSLRWWHGGMEYGALSSIDFRWLRGLGSFVMGDRDYFLLFGIGADSAYQKVPSREPVPAFLTSADSFFASRYIIEKVPPDGADPVAFEGLDDLHRFFDAHRKELVAQAAANEERERERAAYLKANPPSPQNTVLKYWRKASRRTTNTSSSAPHPFMEGKP